jgi:hypothetical protein
MTRVGLKRSEWLKSAAVSFSGLLDGVRLTCALCFSTTELRLRATKDWG